MLRNIRLAFALIVISLVSFLSAWLGASYYAADEPTHLPAEDTATLAQSS